MNNVKVGMYILLISAIGAILGIIITGLDEIFGISSHFVSGGIIGGGVALSIFIVNSLVKNGKLLWLTKK